MSQPPLQLDVPMGLSRYLPPAALAETARAYQSSGVIDSVSVWDQLTFFQPRSMWDPETVPIAALLPDVESFPDPFSTLSFIAAAAPGLSLSTGTDSVRRSPAELFQTMLTLGALSGKTPSLHLGAGEIKQCKPFGWKRKEGIARMEDHLQVYAEFMADPGEPIDFEGNHWTLDQAWLGAERQFPPKVYCLGGGPKLLDIAAKYADGFSTLAPGVANGGAGMEEMATAMRERVASHDRDPDKFEFAIYPTALLIHEDENVIDKALDNPFLRWFTATWGRINQEDWRKDGLEPVRPDWHYAMKLFPMKISDAERDEVLSRVTREHSEKTWIYGNPQQVADQLQPYIDAGVSWLHLADTLVFALDPEDGQQSPGRVIEVAKILKERNA